MANSEAVTGLRSLGSRSGLSTSAIPIQAYPWRTRIALPGAITLAVIVAAGWSARDTVLPATEVQVVPVVLRPVAGLGRDPGEGKAAHQGGSSTGGVVAQAAGWVEPDPFAVAVSALTDGIVREILVLEGQRVTAGDVVARLIDDDAKLAVERAQADLASRQADLTAAQRQWDNPVERRRLVAFTKAALEESKAELEKVDAEVAAERARADEMADLVTRLEKSVAARATAEQELVGLRFKLEAQRAVIRATAARRPVLEALIRQKSADVTAAEENAGLRIEEAKALEAAKAAVLQAQAALGEAKLRLYRTEIRSPADGVVMTRMAEPGGKMMLAMDSPHGSYVARLYDPAKLQVRVDVPLADAHKIGVGTRAEVTAEALPGQTLRGEVTRVVNEADLTKNTLQFKVRIIDQTTDLKPEMLARVKFLAAPRSGATTATSVTASGGGGAHLPFIPNDLVKRDGAATFALTVDRGKNVAVKRTITLGDAAVDGWVSVTSGLSAGDEVIAVPTDVKDGTRVKIAGEVEPVAQQTHGKGGH